MSNVGLPSGLGYICTPLEYERSLRDPSIRCLTRGDSFGLFVIVEVAILSVLAVIFVFALILRNIIWRIRHQTPQTRELRVFQQPMDLLMVSLLFADLIHSIGGIQNFKWILDGKVVKGSYCNSQGILQNVGGAGIALNTLAIAVYTVIGVLSKNGISSMAKTLCVLSGIWGFIFIVNVVGNTINQKPSFQSPVPYWCWISKDYLVWRFLAEYVWFWTTLLFSLLIYIPLYFWMRGNIVLNERSWWKCSFKRVKEADLAARDMRRRSLVMLAYPLAYCICVIPLTIIRWLGFTQESKYGANTIPAAANFAARALFGLSGFLNVALLLATRPLLFGMLMSTTEARAPPPSLPVVEFPYVQEEDPYSFDSASAFHPYAQENLHSDGSDELRSYSNFGWLP